MLRLNQNLGLGKAGDDALGPARGEAIHHFKIAVARALLDNTAAQFFEDDSIYAPDLRSSVRITLFPNSLRSFVA